MSGTVLITDSCCDLPPDVIEAAGVEVLPFPYTLDGREHVDDFGATISYERFYSALDEGSDAHTAQVPFAAYWDAFERFTADGRPVVLISLGSALSGTHDTSVLARERFVAGHPNAEIHCIDSTCVSTGQGLLVLEAARRLRDGATAAETAEWVVANRARVNYLFTVNTFDHLVKGGRVSPMVAMAGTMLNVKPVLHVDAAGALVPIKKPRGRRRAIETLAELAAARIDRPAGTTFVSHGDSPADVALLREQVAERCGLDAGDIGVSRVGTIVGTHTGGSILSVSFWGTPRGQG